MGHYHRRGSRYYSRRDIGRERALQHIEEARLLSLELGGTDVDVKQYFFSLPHNELKLIFDEYGRIYGSDKRDYAEDTFNKWKTGRRKMSGLVAGRLYDLLPPRMPLNKKYELIKTLWESLGPSSNKILIIGPDAHINEIIGIVREYIYETVDNYKIPQNMEKRFKWLSMNDSQLQQQLLNYFLNLEKESAVTGTHKYIPPILQHIRQHSDITSRINQNIKIGNHKFILVFDPNAKGLTLKDSSYFSYSDNTFDWGKLFLWLIVIGFFIWIFSG
jgi:hypothetical protein